jgi:integrase
VSAVLAAVSDRRPQSAPEDPWSRLDAEFLSTAGWDPVTETLAPQPDHPLLGFRSCRVQGCHSEAGPADGFCVTCRKAYQLSGMSVEEFATTGPVRKLRRGEVICAVRGCPRPCRNNSITLCQVHDNHRKRLDLSAAQFVNHPAAQPLPGFGVCRVPVCDRQARYLRGLCGTHYALWWDQDRKGLTTDFDAWCRSASAIASGHAVIMRGLSPTVQAEILFGLQERCRRGVITYLYQLRIVTRRLRAAGAVTITDVDATQLPCHLRRLAVELQDAIARGATPAEEQRKDIWDMSVFGHGRKRLAFTVIPQPWLRDAAKQWVLEEMPLRRGPNVVAVLRDHVNSIGQLGDSMRLHRSDEGMRPAELGRSDIVAFLNRLKHQESSGDISAHQRRKVAQHAALVLRECRAIGLTRPNRSLAGLNQEFTFRRNDLPPVPKEDGPGRALPDPVLAALIGALDQLEAAAGRATRVAVRVLIDTGRRPAEICKLPWDCLDQDRDGKYALIYTDFKNNRVGRRLAISDATAAAIIEHQKHVRQRFPDTPLADLALLPRTKLNPDGTQPLSDDTLAAAHRRWVNDLAPLRRTDGTEFDKSAVFLYAYRHSYAQRHADAGTPVDVLRELMGHRSIATTQGYYSITATRTRKAVDSLAAIQFNARGDHVWSQARVLLESEHQRLAVGQIAVPFGTCTEPSNVQAGGGACPFRFRCLGCGHFRSDPSYLPELRDYLDTLLRDRERILAATELDDWARAEAMPSDTEIARLRHLIRRVEHDLDALDENERRQITEAVQIVRRTRQTVHLGLPSTRSPALDQELKDQT